jgi:hypothetical protein
VAPPTIGEVIYAVNAHTDRIQSLQADRVSLSMPGYPSLRGSLDLERPRRFRLRGSFVGPELDVGSNDEIVWFWAKSNPEPVIYFAQHDQLTRPGGRMVLPFEPTWLIEAFGLVRLDPGGVHDGPSPGGAGKLVVRSRAGPRGEYARTLVIDDRYGWITQQQITDAGGQLLAEAKASQHRFYPAVGVSLPHHLEIRFPPARMSFSIDVARFSINQLVGDPAQLWSVPQMEGYRLMNLAATATSAGDTQPTPPWAAARRPQEMAYRPRYRGYSQRR